MGAGEAARIGGDTDPALKPNSFVPSRRANRTSATLAFQSQRSAAEASRPPCSNCVGLK